MANEAEVAGQNLTIEQFAAMPDYRRELYRKYAAVGFPPDSELPPPGEISNLTKRATPCLVYFIQAGDGPIKIGVATNVKRRLGMLQVGNHERLAVRAVTHGGPQFEAQLHQRFIRHRLHGEWFSPAPEILAEIARLQAAT